jgi:hypothetical protein
MNIAVKPEDIKGSQTLAGKGSLIARCASGIGWDQGPSVLFARRKVGPHHQHRGETGDLFLRGSNVFRSAEAVEHHVLASGGKRVSGEVSQVPVLLNPSHAGHQGNQASPAAAARFVS